MLLYISGQYANGNTLTDVSAIEANINIARDASIKLWEAGHAVICPHLNTALFGTKYPADITYEQYIKGDLVMLGRCDGIVMLPNWEKSKGACIEAEFAEDMHIPIYHYPVIPEVHPTEINRPNQCESFMKYIMQMYRVHLDKNADYSPANIKGTGFIGIIVRMWDKMARLMNLAGFNIEIAKSEYTAPKFPKVESIQDSLMDMAVYGVIAQVERDGQWGT